jgi:hypothetical protein
MSSTVSDSIPSSTCVALTLDFSAGGLQEEFVISVYLATMKTTLRAEVQTQKLQNINMKPDFVS